MPMTREEFKSAFRQVISSEFSQIPEKESDIDYTFSDAFEKKMQKLIKAQRRRPRWHFHMTKRKRIAILVAILIALLAATACSVKAIREPLIHFLKGQYEYSIFQNITGGMTVQYKIAALPEGFAQTNLEQDDTSVTVTYENAAGDVIELKQLLSSEAAFTLDTKGGELYAQTVGSHSVDIYEQEDAIMAFWLQDDYMLLITYYGKPDLQLLKELVASVEMVE